jgi:hypothetical protein
MLSARNQLPATVKWIHHRDACLEYDLKVWDSANSPAD